MSFLDRPSRALLASVGAALLLATAAAAAPPPKRARAVPLDRVVAVVNDTVILESEVYQRVLPLTGELDKIADPAERGRQLQGLMRQALEEMIDEELILQAATESQLEVTNEEVDRALEEVKRQNKVTDAQLAEALKLQGYTVDEYRRDVRRQILRLRAINVLVRPRVTVTDDEVREHYDKLIGKTSSIVETHLYHILVALPEKPTPEDMERARRRCGDLTARARAGEEFGALAKAESDDPSTRETGGDLGWFKRGELPTEWEEIVFAMVDGEVRGPIRGPRGLHVFRVGETHKEAVRPFDEVKDELQNQLYQAELEKQTKIWLDEQRRKAHVETKL